MKDFFDNYLKTKLREHGLNPDNPSFLKDLRYIKEFKNEKVGCEYGFVTYDYYIRKEWFSGETPEKEYGRFDPQALWDGNPVRANDLIQEIRDETQQEIMNEMLDEIRKELSETQLEGIGQEISKKQLDEIWDLLSETLQEKIDKKLQKCEEDNIKNKLFGTSGLRGNLKRRVGFDTALYGKQQMFEEFKLLKILYHFEKHHNDEVKVNVTKMLGDLSIEYVDRSIIGENSVHGQVVTDLLTEVHLASDPYFPVIAKFETPNFAEFWNYKLNQIYAVAIMQEPKNIRIAELRRILDYAMKLLDRLGEPQPVTDGRLLESFYLRVLQLQQIARLHDIDRVTKFIAGSKQTSDLLKQEIRPFTFPSEVIADAETFIRDHMDDIASFVYFGEEITKKHREFLEKHAPAVQYLLDECGKQKFGFDSQLTPLFLISCLQEIALSDSLKAGDDEYAFKNYYYKADGKERTLTSVLKNMTKQLEVEEAFRLVWTIKIERRIYANLRLLDEYLLLQDIGIVCNRMIEKTMQITDPITMRVWNEFLLSQLIVNDSKPIVHAVRKFNFIVNNETGLSCDFQTMQLFLLHVGETEAIASILAQKINTVLRRPSVRADELRCLRVNLKVNFSPGDTYYLVYSIDVNKKLLNLISFMPFISSEDLTLFSKVGLRNFFDGHKRFSSR